MRQDTWSQLPGCFGVPGLHHAEDWDVLAKKCIHDCLSLADSIRSQSPSPTPALLQHFDDLSDRLCSVLDVAELCRNVHPNPEFVNAANEAYMKVSSITQELNADESIYKPLTRLYDRHERSFSDLSIADRYRLSEEDAIMVKSLKEDFERGGIHLPRDEKNQLINLQQDLNNLSSQFVNGDDISSSTLVIEESKLLTIPSDIRAQLNVQQHWSDNGERQHGYVVVSLTHSNAQLMLRWIRQSDTREKVYRQIHDSDGSKTKILDSILSKRHKLARILGHTSYADLMFSDRLASSPSAVLDFLTDFSKVIQVPAAQERLSIERAKQKSENDSTTNGLTSLHAWDRNYYIGRIKAHNFDLSSTNLSRYFPLKSCLTALSDIVNHVFGIRLLPADDLSPSERWHNDVRKFQVVDQQNGGDGQVLGYIYFDLYPRDGKYTHAAHFSIRCGRQPANQSEYQMPVVALVCNFGLHSPSGQRLLSMTEYETLFHEFGHSLHSILSRTKYQHLSGTRVVTDLVEVPSHIFEHFAWDHRIISRYAKHCHTGDEMPTRTVKALCASRQGFAATDLQTQILFSAMDLQFHGVHPPIGRTENEYAKLQRQLTVMEPDKGVDVPATFHHFVSYGAGYYSYVFARILSAQIWADLFESNPFSREGGDKLRSGLLALGASKDASSLVSDLVSGDVTCDAFLHKSGTQTAGNDSPSLRLPL